MVQSLASKYDGGYAGRMDHVPHASLQGGAPEADLSPDLARRLASRGWDALGLGALLVLTVVAFVVAIAVVFTWLKSTELQPTTLNVWPFRLLEIAQLIGSLAYCGLLWRLAKPVRDGRLSPARLVLRCCAVATCVLAIGSTLIPKGALPPLVLVAGAVLNQCVFVATFASVLVVLNDLAVLARDRAARLAVRFDAIVAPGLVLAGIAVAIRVFFTLDDVIQRMQQRTPQGILPDAASIGSTMYLALALSTLAVAVHGATLLFAGRRILRATSPTAAAADPRSPA